MRIVAIDAVPLNLRFNPEVAPHMLRAATHGTEVVLYRVELDRGVEGWGDDLGRPVDVSSWVGQDAVAALRGCRQSGLQMALFDAVGKALGVPAHALMGRRVRSMVPFAYWTIDLPPETLAAQIRRAASLGYTAYKFKCRPWWDPREQLAAAAEVAPPGFHLWLDFNGHLREARLALPILRDLARYECVGGFESPIPQRDLEGYRAIRRSVDRPVVGHYGGGCCHVESDRSFDPGLTGEVQLRDGMLDGYVLGGGDVDALRSIAGALHAFHRPFWIQTVGTALRAAWIAHLACTCAEATLSHLAAHDLWETDVARSPRVRDGMIAVPEGPGLGIAPDPAALERIRATPPPAAARRISTVVYPSGTRWHFSDEMQRHETYYFGHLPGFVPGVRLEIRADDGTADFDDRFRRCLAQPVVED
jgi:L-alanine-DL-glutamate epimerase-like enolase superfamily enzyme